MLQQYEFNAQRHIQAKGRHFRYVSGSSVSGNLGMVLLVDSVPQGVYYPGDAIEYPQEYSQWELRGVSPDLRGVVSIGSGRVESQRLDGTVSINGGTVNTISEGLAQSLAGQVFSASGVIEQAASGCYPVIQLWNPAGSGRIMAVDALDIRLGNTDVATWVMVRDAVQLPTPLVTTPAVNFDTTGPASATVCHERVNMTPAAADAQASGAAVVRWRGVVTQPSGVYDRRFDRPVIVRPGSGLTVVLRATTTGLSARWEWRELIA